MKAGSLRWRLLAAAAISIAVALFIAGLALTSLFEQQVRARVMLELDNDLLQLAGLIEVSDTGDINILQGLADPGFQRPYGGKYWYIDQLTPTIKKQVLRSRSLWDADITGNVGPEGEPLVSTERTITVKNAGGDISLRLVVSTHSTEITSPLAEFRNQLTLYLLLIGLALTAAAWLQVTIGLRPLQALREQLSLLDTQKSKRLTGEFPTEVEPLVLELNHVLDLRDKSLARARHRAGDLAHGLMTPLTILSAIARKVPRRGAEIDEQIETMRTHVERSLMRARLSSGRGHDLTNLSDAVDAVFTTVGKLPRGDEIQWHNMVPADAVVPLERSDLIELLGNLLDNARKFAKSQVRLRFADRHIFIDDDGPGVAGAEIALILQRGRRLDESRKGFGLGLAIVEDIADLYQLELSFGKSDLGGLQVKLGIKP
jgi:signal transduction histidine kinase